MGADIISTTAFTFVKLLVTLDIIAVQLITLSHKPSENYSRTGFFSRLTLSLYSNICPTRCNVTQFILSGNCSTCFGWF